MTAPSKPAALAAILALATVMAASIAMAETVPLRKRSFELSYTAKVAEIPRGAKKVEVWVPYPQSDEHQRISDIRVNTPVPAKVYKEEISGNSMLHFVIENPEQPVELSLIFAVERQEYVHKDFPKDERGGKNLKLTPETARWLKPEKLVPLDERIRKLALEVTANQQTPLEKARAIYDYVVKTMSYDKSGTGWGNGDIYWACDAKRGNCTDFHALFTGLSRAAGIPARFSIGFPIPADQEQGEIGGYHCWAEFYLAGFGWVPVDASEAWKNPGKKEYFFGALDEHRVQLTVGRDLKLEPRQQGDPLNYFVYPYAEVDGKPLKSITKKFTYRKFGGGLADTR